MNDRGAYELCKQEKMDAEITKCLEESICLDEKEDMDEAV